MSAVRISEQEALSAGAELWVIRNDPALAWWSKLDFLSAYLLSENYFRPKKQVPAQLLNILEATRFDTFSQPSLQNYVLLGSEDHFFNKWVLVWNQLKEKELADSIVDLSVKLKFSSVRIFSDSKSLTEALAARPSASSLNISFIENT
ncbi:MAG: hypothetical protein K0R29_10 [Pseudobdellovibrio sp.]|jgi:hypothetical protein|nr:hypothetical protein [Pseudobdellovibrio sp.]